MCARYESLMQAKRIPCSSHAWKGPRHYWNSFNQSKLPFGYPPRRYRRRGSLSRGTRRESFLLSGFIHSNPSTHYRSSSVLRTFALFISILPSIHPLRLLASPFRPEKCFHRGVFFFFTKFRGKLEKKFSLRIVTTPFKVFISKIISSFYSNTVSATRSK